MYESHFGLKAKPFSVTPDPRFLYWANGHSMAFAMLQYGIVSHAGFTVITGEVGAGKTTLLQQLLSKLPKNITVGMLSNTQGDKGVLLQWILMSFGQEFRETSYVHLHKQFQDFLIEQHRLGRRTVLIIDEAQNLGTATLEELRMISNVNTHEQELLQIVLSGQPELKRLLAAPELRQFVQRVSSDFHLSLLSRDEVFGYITHRMEVVGATRQIFSEEAIRLIAGATKGTPRLINILCDTSLLYAYASGQNMVTAETVEKVIEDKRQFGVFPIEDVLAAEELARQKDSNPKPTSTEDRDAVSLIEGSRDYKRFN